MAKVTACATLGFSLSSLEVALKHISDYGFKNVEISEMLTHCKHFPIDTADPVEVRNLLDKYSLTPVVANVAVASINSEKAASRKLPAQTQSAAETQEIIDAKKNRIFYKLHVKNDAEEYAARVHRLIDKAKIAGIPMLSIQGGRRTQIEDIDRELKAAAKVIDAQSEYAKAAGIKIILEMPHVWDLYYDVEKSKQMLS